MLFRRVEASVNQSDTSDKPPPSSRWSETSYKVRPRSFPPKLTSHTDVRFTSGNVEDGTTFKAKNINTTASREPNIPTHTNGGATSSHLQNMWSNQKQQWQAFEEQQYNSGATAANRHPQTQTEEAIQQLMTAPPQVNPGQQRAGDVGSVVKGKKKPFSVFLTSSMEPVLGMNKVPSRLLEHRNPETGLYKRSWFTTTQDKNPCVDEIEAFRKCFANNEATRSLVYARNCLADCVQANTLYFYKK